MHTQSKREQWGETEDDILIRKVGYYGRNWAKIATYIPGRSMDELYARYLTLETFASRIIQNHKRLKRIRYTGSSNDKSEEKLIQKKRKTQSQQNTESSHFCPSINLNSYPPKSMYFTSY